ncbi:MAG: trypsin-like peptidase domain-containing protein [Nitrospira sp.]|nr:trypsin-like peptidase domain-containing protein [Nitrospira sp.]
MLNRASSTLEAFHACCGLAFCMLLLLSVVFPSSLWAQDIAQVKKGVVKITAQVDGKNRVGSGVVVKLDEDHVYIVTASHVIEGDQHPNVFFYAAPHRAYRARVLGLEGGNPAGLAALLVEGKIPSDLVALPLDQAVSVSGGESITLIGFPRVEGSMWTVTTGTLSGRRGSALSFSGTADEGNSGGPVLFQNKVVGIVTEVGAKFNTAVPAVVARFALDGWGVRLLEETRQPPTRSSEEEPEPVVVQPTSRELVSGTYHGFAMTLLGGTSVIQAIYKQNGDQVSGTYADNQGDAGVMQGRLQGNVFAGRLASQVFQGVACDFTSEVAAGGKTIQGTVTCNNGNVGSFALERQ